MRTIIELPEEQVRRLAELCHREGLSRAEAVRRAVAAYLEARQAPPDDDLFGIWRDSQVDGLEYEEQLRREWA